MEAAKNIRACVDRVSQLRRARESRPALAQALQDIKRLQSRRFAATYADLLAGGPHQAASRFFLEELYSDRDYAERDAQFAKIAGAIERLFPAQVAAMAQALAELHALTEELDHAMAQAWMDTDPAAPPALRYATAWRAVGKRDGRLAQLRVVKHIGREMSRLTRTPGLRLMLKMMRGPAGAAGLSALQRFLESGFDTFAAMARQPDGAERFLQTIAQREEAFIALLFDAPLVACETALAPLLGQAR